MLRATEFHSGLRMAKTDIEIDASVFEQKARLLAKKLGKNESEFIKNQTGLLAREVAKMTPPDGRTGWSPPRPAPTRRPPMLPTGRHGQHVVEDSGDLRVEDFGRVRLGRQVGVQNFLDCQPDARR